MISTKISHRISITGQVKQKIASSKKLFFLLCSLMLLSSSAFSKNTGISVCTYTQGYYGNAGGKASDGLGNTYTTIQLITKSLNNWGGTLVIGKTGHSITIPVGSAQAVIDYLPGGGPSSTLKPGNVVLGSSQYTTLYGSGRIGNSLLAQTITLGLNLKVGNGVLGTLSLNGLVSPSIVNALTDKTVTGLFELANQALAGNALPAGITLDAIQSAVNSINERFDECKPCNECTQQPHCTFTVNVIESSKKITDYGKSNGSFTVSFVGAVAPIRVIVTSTAGTETTTDDKVVQDFTVTNTNNLTITGLGSDYYWVKFIDKNGCEGMADVDMQIYCIKNTGTVKAGTIDCIGGTTTLTATATGGSGSFNYSLDNITFQSSNVFTVPAGTYTIYVKDMILGCSVALPKVTVLPGTRDCSTHCTFTSNYIPGSVKITDYNQNNGSFTVKFVGAVAPIHVIVSSTLPTEKVVQDFTVQNTNDLTISGLGSNYYWVKFIDKNGCEGMTDVDMQIYCNKITGSAKAGTIDCIGGNTTLTATATGGSGSFNYSLDNSTFQSSNIFTVPAGTYTVYVKDMILGCTVTLPAVTVLPGTRDCNMHCTFTVNVIESSKKITDYGKNNGSFTASFVGAVAPIHVIVTSTAGTATTTDDKVVQDFTVQNTNDLTISGLGSDYYWVKFIDKNGCEGMADVDMQIYCNKITGSVKAGTINCKSGYTTLTVTATGGSGTYLYSLDNGSFQSSNIFSVPAGTYTVSVKDFYLGCIIPLAPVTVNPGTKDCNTVCTYTQGYYGNAGGKSADGLGNTYTTIQLITKSLNNWGGTLVIGKPGHSISIPVANPQAVIDYLPGGGPSSVLKSGDVVLGSSDYIKAYGSGRISNSLLAQTITLGLNLKIGEGVLGSLSLNGLVSPSIVNALTDKTVTGLFDLANKALAGYALPAGITLDAIQSAVDSINEHFDECKPCAEYLPCSSCKQSVTSAASTEAAPAEQLANDASPSACNLKVAVEPKNPMCYNNVTGSVISTVTGSVGKVSYLWSNGSTGNNLMNIGAGTYSVKVKDQSTGCQVTSETVTLINPAQLVATAKSPEENGYNIVCKDSKTGSIDLTVKGGTGAYTYEWNNGATSQDLAGLDGGKYVVTVKDVNKCTVQTGITLREPAQKLEVSPVVRQITCNSETGSIELNVSGGVAPYTCKWSNGSTGNAISKLAAGKYTVTVKDAVGCEFSGSYEINKYDLAVSLSAGRSSVNKGEATTLHAEATGGAKEYTYTWSSSETLKSMEKGNATVNPSGNTTYTVTVKDGYGCSVSGSVTVKVTEAQAASSAANESVNAPEVAVQNVSVSPNPNNGNFNVMLNGFAAGKTDIKILDASGKEVAAKALTTSSFQSLVPFNLASLPKGVYIVNVISGDKTYQEKMVIR
jgi:hypothetical protein